jgi:signal transduction histidine kinase
MKLVTDPALLRRAIEQLMVNALEATPDGGAVKAMVKPLSKGVRIEIWNEGVMSDSVQRQVFKRSFTTKQKGTGLGAYSAKLYVERYLSGRVGFRSSNGEGTTFWLDLTGE